MADENPIVFGVTIEDAAAMPEDEFLSVWTLLGRVAWLRGQRLLTEREKAKHVFTVHARDPRLDPIGKTFAIPETTTLDPSKVAT